MNVHTHADLVFECKDRFGSISVYQFENIIITDFAGACGLGLVKKYTSALHQHVSHLPHKHWGYLSISERFEAATKDAIDELSRSFLHCQKAGCVADAYVIASAVGQKQIKAMREQFSTQTPFDNTLFIHLDDAIAFLLTAIKAYE